MSTRASVHSIESFGSVDGPGVRFIVFLNGCKMRCAYCHNPDTWKLQETTHSSDELLKQALRYKPYWKENGGITVSGGEPLLQMDFLIDFFTKAKAQGIHTTLDTCGQPFTREGEWFTKFNQLMEVCDLVLLDIKHINTNKHKLITGHPNENILDMATYLSEIGKPVWIRQVLVPELSDDEDDLKKLKEFIDSLNNVEKVELLPYHTFGIPKWDALGYEYKLRNTQPPTKEELEKAKKILGI